MWRHYLQPELAKLAYASPTVLGCTGAMIGPNIMMTAAHCGDYDRTINFLLYNADTAVLHTADYSTATSTTYDSAYITETFQCHILLDTFGNADISLYFCDPNASGVSPGDKYGYVDMDPTQPAVGTTTVAASRHPITSLGITDGQIYSPGSVTSTTTCIWNSACGGSPWIDQMSSPVGITYNMWGEAGVSGSAAFNPPDTARQGFARIGPVSTADGSSRSSLSMYDILWYGKVPGWTDGSGVHHTGVFEGELSTLGVPNPWKYQSQYLDNDYDWLFDVQSEIELIRGENARDWYYLGFDSARRNNLWYRAGGVTFDIDNARAVVAYAPSPSQWTKLLSLPSGRGTCQRG